jgi:hypothetical protein
MSTRTATSRPLTSTIHDNGAPWERHPSRLPGEQGGAQHDDALGGGAPAGEFASDQQAHAHCPSNTVVWVNTRSRIHHRLLAATALACRCRWIGAVFLSNWRPSGISVELYFGTAGSMFAPKTV